MVKGSGFEAGVEGDEIRYFRAGRNISSERGGLCSWYEWFSQNREGCRKASSGIGILVDKS